MKTATSYIIKTATLLVIAIGILVLLGWQLDITFFKQFLPKSVAMNPMTAIAFLFSGFSFLLLLQKPGTKYQRSIAKSLATLVLMIAVLRLVAVFNLVDVGIDRLLYTAKIAASLFNGTPQSMAPNTALAFFLTGAALLFLSYKNIVISQYLSLVTSAIALLSIIGYAYNVSKFYGVSSFLPMAFHTGLCFFFLSTAILFSHGNKGFIAAITSRHAGGKAARVLLPASIATPFILGFFILYGAAMKSYSFSSGMALLVTAVIFIFAFLVWVTAFSINKFEIVRVKENEISNEKLKQAAGHIFDLYNNAPCGYHSLNDEGYFVDINDTELNWLGYLREEVVGKLRLIDMLTPESKTLFTAQYPLFPASGTVKDLFLEMTRKDGTVFTVLISAFVITDADSRFLQSRATVIDYTERKIQDDQIKRFNLELEKQVQDQTKLIIDKEQQYRFLLQNMREGIQIISYDWRFLFVNKSVVHQSKFFNENELLGHTIMEKFPGIEQKPLFKVLQTCMQKRVPEMLENEFEFPDGTTGWFKLSIQPVPEGLFILSTDITEQKKAETEIQQSREKYIAVINNVDGIVWEADAKTFVFNFVSKQAERLLGYPVERWIKEPSFWADHIHEEDRKWAIHYCVQCTHEKKAHQFEYRMIAADGSIIWLRDIVSVIIENNQPVKLSGIMVDITERKQMERELSNKMLSQQKLITQITIQAQEKERNELGRELHDNINQILAVVKLYLGMVKSSNKKEKDLIVQSSHHLEEAMNEIRKLSHSLVAPSLGDSSLKVALEELIQSVNFSNKIALELLVDDNYHEITVDKNKELVIYRIIQEQLNNILKYANATEVSILLKQNAGILHLSVIDNGVGFDLTQKRTGIGLVNINSRVDFYAGTMNIISAPGKGCTLEVVIPA